jgi:hypothetical protein
MPPEPEDKTTGILEDLDMQDVQPPDFDEPIESGPPDEAVPEAEEESPTAETQETSESEPEQVEPGQGQDSELSPEPEVPDPAQYAALKQSYEEEKISRQRDREAMLKEIIKLRRSRQQDAQPAETQVEPQQQNIPVEFDENGQPYVSRANLALMMQGQQDPVQQFVGSHHKMTESIVLEEPVTRAPAHQRFRDAWTNLDEAVKLAQAEYDQYPTDVDGMIDLIEHSGLDKQFIENYPDIASSSRDIEDFLNAASQMNPRRMRRMLDHIATRGKKEESTASVDDADTRSRAEKLSKKPIPMRRHGGNQVPKTKSRIDELSNKSPFEWTEADSKQFVKEMAELDEKELNG